MPDIVKVWLLLFSAKGWHGSVCCRHCITLNKESCMISAYVLSCVYEWGSPGLMHFTGTCDNSQPLGFSSVYVCVFAAVLHLLASIYANVSKLFSIQCWVFHILASLKYKIKFCKRNVLSTASIHVDQSLSFSFAAVLERWSSSYALPMYFQRYVFYEVTNSCKVVRPHSYDFVWFV